MTPLDNLTPEELLVLTNILTVALSKDKTIDELNTIGNFIVGIGCLMLTVASQQQLLSTKQDTTTSPTTDDTIIG